MIALVTAWKCRFLFQSLTRDSNHSNRNYLRDVVGVRRFQSLTRDSNHSNPDAPVRVPAAQWRFNPSRGIAIIQTWLRLAAQEHAPGFNPSRGIAIIQTRARARARRRPRPFQSLTRDSNHSNMPAIPGAPANGAFQSLTRDSNHSNGDGRPACTRCAGFQSLTRDSNHSNSPPRIHSGAISGFNPSRGIAIIQTRPGACAETRGAVSIPHAG